MMRRRNPNGGAIAMGYPLGVSGARMAGAGAWQLQRSGGRYALCTMCVGAGQGIALILAGLKLEVARYHSGIGPISKRSYPKARELADTGRKVPAFVLSDQPVCPVRCFFEQFLMRS